MSLHRVRVAIVKKTNNMLPREKSNKCSYLAVLLMVTTKHGKNPQGSNSGSSTLRATKSCLIGFKAHPIGRNSF